MDDLKLTEIAGSGDGLRLPMDLAFNPKEEGELWVTNRNDFSIVVIKGAQSGNPTTKKYANEYGGGAHFIAKPAALAFGGTTGMMATAQQEDSITQASTPADFMGPTLWTTNLAQFEAGHSSHTDMLHNSPLGSGIAWVEGNAYWYYDGAHGSLTLYDFNSDHGLGGGDHTDGETYRFLDGELGYEPSVASHVAYDHDNKLVYAADTANNRIVRLDPTSGTKGGPIQPNYDGCTQNYYDGANLEVFVDGSAVQAGMQSPSGIEIHNGVIFVSDYATSRIFAFNADGTLIDYLNTGIPANNLMGMSFGTDDALYLVSAGDNKVFRLSIGS